MDAVPHRDHLANVLVRVRRPLGSRRDLKRIEIQAHSKVVEVVYDDYRERESIEQSRLVEIEVTRLPKVRAYRAFRREGTINDDRRWTPMAGRRTPRVTVNDEFALIAGDVSFSMQRTCRARRPILAMRTQCPAWD